MPPDDASAATSLNPISVRSGSFEPDLSTYRTQDSQEEPTGPTIDPVKRDRERCREVRAKTGDYLDGDLEIAPIDTDHTVAG